jgi:hypothetical protein
MNRHFRKADTTVAPGGMRPHLRSPGSGRPLEQSALVRTIEAARDALSNRQSARGFWQFELEADCTIPAEYIVMMHFLDDIDSSSALLGLLAAGEVSSGAVQHGVEYLLRAQQADGLWSDPGFTAPGFPRVFYLRYHGYCAYFPLWALAAYKNLACTR